MGTMIKKKKKKKAAAASTNYLETQRKLYPRGGSRGES